MPKGSISGPHFNRSILILTPQRALKFTATSQDRHFIWLTALSFLSHSPLSVNDLTAVPPPPPDDQILGNPPPPSLAGSLRRRPIRDSIRIAKGSQKGGLRSFTTDGSVPVSYDESNSRPPTRDYYDPTQDPALPPTIKRFHSRKRSNTAPKPPPSSFRGFTASSRRRTSATCTWWVCRNGVVKRNCVDQWIRPRFIHTVSGCSEYQQQSSRQRGQ